MTEAQIELGDVATKIIYEDDEVRIWDQVIGPHELLGPHRHENDYFLLDVKGDDAVLQIEYLPGHDGPRDDEHPYKVKRGNHWFIGKGAVEQARNMTDKPVRLILVELLNDKG